MNGLYGQAPVGLDYHELDWHEFMHWLYLPVRLPAREDLHHTVAIGTGIELPPNLKFLYGAVADAWADAQDHGFWDPYIYVTARRGWATADNPLNRPGWHCDGFGTEDLNYVWCDEFPTVWSSGPFVGISDDHLESLRQFDQQAGDAEIAFGTSLAPPGLRPVERLEPFRLYRFTPNVVHTAPRPWDIGGGGMRSFLKISVSNHRYNLAGNSHNHELTYRWEMHPRDVLRNDPHKAGFDYVDEDEVQ